jgi:lipopolysaccharide biosynthesis protein
MECRNLQLDSVFNMRRPYDLVAFLKQEERVAALDDMKQQMQRIKEDRVSVDNENKGSQAL